jgi:molybdopterin synthase sulfur carrier subunit
VKVRVQMFAVARQLAGRDLVELDLGDGANVGDLRRKLVHDIPAMANVISHMSFAVNAEYATDSTFIPADADVACIPPVSGG